MQLFHHKLILRSSAYHHWCLEQLEELRNKHGKLTDEEKQLEKDLTAAIAEEQRTIDSLTKASYDEKVTTAEEANEKVKETNNKSTEAQAKSYDNLAKTTEKALEDINKGLKDSKGKIKDFVKESKEQADKLKKAFDGIGKKISGEFEKAQKGIADSFKKIGSLTTSATKNLNSSWTSALTKVANDVRSKLNTINNIYQSFSTSISNMTNGLVNSVSTKITGLNDSYTRSFDNIKNNIYKVMDSCYIKVNSQLNNIRSLFNNFNATLKVKIPHFYMTGQFNAETGQVPKVGVNYFARGGVVDRATLGVFGEAGKEAIVPLEHNTEWMDTLEGIMGAAFNKAMQGNNNMSAVNDQLLQILQVWLYLQPHL